MPFCSLIAVTDLGQDADRVLPIVATLAEAGSLPVELWTVVPPDEDEAEARRELQHRATTHRLERATMYVLHDDFPGRAISSQVAHRDGSLLAIATTARGAPWEARMGTVTEEVLRGARQPVLVIGPVVAGTTTSARRTIVTVDAAGMADVAVPVVEAWMRAFGGKVAEAVEVVPPDGWPPWDAVTPARHDGYVAQLGRRQIDACSVVLRAQDPAQAIVDHCELARADSLVMTCPRWEGDPSHWFVTVRRVIRTAPVPVLVVPSDLFAPSSMPSARSAASANVPPPCR